MTASTAIPAQSDPKGSSGRAFAADLPDPAISIRGLAMTYGTHPVLHGIDLDVGRGEVCALVGPNGAGKTTTVEILEGYRQRSGGEVSVLGTDPGRPTRRWRSRIGIVLQTCEMPGDLTVGELVARFAGFYPHPRPVGETLHLVGLDAEAGQRAGTLSGGQRRRLDVAMALVGDPELLFLDEPTTGFDPSARQQAWAVIARLRSLGKTIVLTTHYMEEAEALADRVVVVVDGRIVAEGTPETLGGRDQAAAQVRFRRPDGLVDTQLPSVVAGRYANEQEVINIVDADQGDLYRVLDWAQANRVLLRGLTVERPSLEAIYLQLTGGLR